MSWRSPRTAPRTTLVRGPTFSPIKRGHDISKPTFMAQAATNISRMKYPVSSNLHPASPMAMTKAFIDHLLGQDGLSYDPLGLVLDCRSVTLDDTLRDLLFEADRPSSVPLVWIGGIVPP